MKRNLLIGLVFLFSAPFLLAQENSSVAKPRIVCDEASFDFGSRENNGFVEHDFVIRNAGNLSLEIQNVSSSCGCTVANPSKNVIPPGDDAIISAKFDLRGRVGNQIKTITIHSNDPDRPQFTLQLVGMAQQEIHVSPSGVFLGRISRDETRTTSVEIISSKVPFTIRNIRVSEPYIEAVEDPVSDDPAARSRRISITLKAPLPEGRISTSVFVDTDMPTSAVLTIPVAAYVATPPEQR